MKQTTPGITFRLPERHRAILWRLAHDEERSQRSVISRWLDGIAEQRGWDVAAVIDAYRAAKHRAAE